MALLDSMPAHGGEGGDTVGMTDRETVITHLQIIHTWASFARERDLQFFSAKHLEDIAQWTADALALLKEQEPRIIPFDEINNHEVLWLEVKGVETEEGLAPWVKTLNERWFSPLFCNLERPDMILSRPDEYGKLCRCWTSRPTDEQRKAVKWDATDKGGY